MVLVLFKPRNHGVLLVSMAMDVIDKYEDPSIVGSMSGQKEDSKALTRYRDIDHDIKTVSYTHLTLPTKA